VLNKSKKALYFSRSIIPYIRNIEQDKWAESYNYLNHIGIYAYKSSVLKEITNLSSSSLEMAESLEQNRWLENVYTIRTELTEYESYSIDSPEDLENVKKKFL
jgi:3-deoxy-manno-octulosonate cytidylyltransferase (CMP-KDO synthetase)